MKARRLAWNPCLLALAILWSSMLLAGEEGQGILVLHETRVFGTTGRAAVSFPHEEHWGLEGVDCLTCHHRYEGGKNVLDTGELMSADEPPRCASCHQSRARLEAAFHLECVGCHERTKRQGKPSGPRVCGDCHPWK